MSEKKFDAQVNYGWGLSLNMTGKAPAVAKRIFDTYADALSYANDINDSAIEGLVLSVVADTDITKNGLYFVKQVATPAVEADEEKGIEGVDAKEAILVKMSTTSDSQATADEVQELLNSEISARTESDEVLSGAIQSNYSAITATSQSLETLSDNFDIAVSEFQAADTYLSGVTSGLVESLKSFKIKDVTANDKMLAVDSDGKLSSTFNVSYDQDAHKIYFKGANDSSLGEVDASDFIADGMLSGATLVTEGDKTYIKFHFNTIGGGNDKISLDVTKLLNGTELHNLEASLSAHTASTTYHFTSDEKAKLTDLYTKAQLDAKFSANTEEHSDLSSDIAEVNSKVENILGNNTGYTGVTIPELNSGITANTQAIEELKDELSGHTIATAEEFESVKEELSALTTANTSAHTTLQNNIDSANTRIDNVITAYTESDKAINDKISVLEGKVSENEEVVAEAITDLQANKVSSVVAEDGSNIVVNEVKDENGISYTIGFQWLTF